MNGHVIHTAYWQKPGPERAWDWSATFDNYDGALDSRHPQGYGPTELFAVADLLQQERERLEKRSFATGDSSNE